MPYATILSRSTTNNGTNAAASTSWSVNVGSPVNGDLLLAVFGYKPTATPTAPSGWTALQTKLDRVSVTTQYVAYKVADGTEGATQTFTFSVAVQPAVVCYRVSSGTFTGVPAISTGFANFSTTPDAPSFTSSFGTVETTWISALTSYSNENKVTASPSGYANSGSFYYGGVSNMPLIGYADKEALAASEDAGAWTLSTGLEFVVNTIAVQGISGPTPTPAFGRYGVRGPVR